MKVATVATVAIAPSNDSAENTASQQADARILQMAQGSESEISDYMKGTDEELTDDERRDNMASFIQGQCELVKAEADEYSKVLFASFTDKPRETVAKDVLEDILKNAALQKVMNTKVETLARFGQVRSLIESYSEVVVAVMTAACKFAKQSRVERPDLRNADGSPLSLDLPPETYTADNLIYITQWMVSGLSKGESEKEKLLADVGMARADMQRKIAELAQVRAENAELHRQLQRAQTQINRAVTDQQKLVEKSVNVEAVDQEFWVIKHSNPRNLDTCKSVFVAYDEDAEKFVKVSDVAEATHFDDEEAAEGALDELKEYMAEIGKKHKNYIKNIGHYSVYKYGVVMLNGFNTAETEEDDD